MSKYPFEATLAEIEANADAYVDSVFSGLASDFLVLPKGQGFVDYPTFEAGYEALKKACVGFQEVTPELVLPAVLRTPIALVVFRTMLGFTAPEWAYLASQETGVEIPQGFARGWDRKARVAVEKPLKPSKPSLERLKALVSVGCEMLAAGAGAVARDRIHRLDKADTKTGLDGIRNAAGMGIPYAMLLYERFLGRPFAGHRDSVSELMGNTLESAVEDVLSDAGISYRKTKRAERIPGMKQAPDFLVPSEFSPQVVIEAKIAEDDGTARDKVARIIKLCRQSTDEMPEGRMKYEVIACIGGRGFGVRREDMRQLLVAARGKVFTQKTLDQMVKRTSLRGFATKKKPR